MSVSKRSYLSSIRNIFLERWTHLPFILISSLLMTSGSGKPKWNQRPIQSRDNSHDELAAEASAKNKREIIIIALTGKCQFKIQWENSVGDNSRNSHFTLSSFALLNEANFSCTKTK